MPSSKLYRKQAPPTSAARRFWTGLPFTCYGRVEELRLEDLDLAGRRLSVRSGKGLKDRTVYLTASVIFALQEYLAVRGIGPSDHVFLYRNEALKKDLARSRIRDAGKRVGVKVYPHKLRHTTATQLLNAGCPVTSIQKFLGHKKLNTTMVYARAYDATVEADYFAAMSRVEQRLSLASQPPAAQASVEPEERNELLALVEEPEEEVNTPVGENERAELLKLADQLAEPELSMEVRLDLVLLMRALLQKSVDEKQNAGMEILSPSEHLSLQQAEEPP